MTTDQKPSLAARLREGFMGWPTKMSWEEIEALLDEVEQLADDVNALRFETGAATQDEAIAEIRRTEEASRQTSLAITERNQALAELAAMNIKVEQSADWPIR